MVGYCMLLTPSALTDRVNHFSSDKQKATELNIKGVMAGT